MTYGVLRYLIKPVNREALLEAIGYAARLSAVARARRAALEKKGEPA
jgi:FixJ family two-component response regulator